MARSSRRESRGRRKTYSSVANGGSKNLLPGMKTMRKEREAHARVFPRWSGHSGDQIRGGAMQVTQNYATAGRPKESEPVRKNNRTLF